MSGKKKQTVIKVDINCGDCQTEIFAKVGKIKGVQSLVVDAEKKTLTVVGTVEPSPIFKALKKIKKNPEILTVGAPKPKCRYCKYFVCNCGIARFPASQPTELAPPPPGWRIPPPCTDQNPCSCAWPCPNPNSCWSSSSCPPQYPFSNIPSWCPQPTPYPSYLPPQCELVAVNYPPSPDRNAPCSIM